VVLVILADRELIFLGLVLGFRFFWNGDVSSCYVGLY